MRVFWAVLALLAAMGAWFALRDPAAPTASPVASPVASPSSDAPSQVEATSPPVPQNDEPNATAADAPTAAQPTAPAPTPPAADRPAPDLDLLGEDGERIAPVAAPAAAPDARRPEDTVRRIDARTLELDGRFRITGNGSPDDPYRISWELLTSASATVDPARNLLEAPPWVRLLDGTYIEISAYYSTPVRVRRTSSVLLTLNRWDGCCIGLPPTPFDAIDASLRQPIDMNALHLISFGTFRGRLVVEPLVAAQYLLGLYRIEDATFEKK